MTRHFLSAAFAAALMGLSACGDAVPDAPLTPAPEPVPVPAAGPPEPPPAAKPGFVGRWAASPELCEAGAWSFEEQRVSTAGEVSCEFGAVMRTPTGYDVQAQCVAEAPAQPYTFSLALEDAPTPSSMTVTGGPWGGPITLMRCPQPQP